MKTFKRILVIALFVLLNSALFAQNETKSANVIKQRLDSVIDIQTGLKTEFLYDNFGNNTSMTKWTWSNASMTYQISSKNEYSFDLNGNCIINQPYTWDKTLNLWLISESKYEQSFDRNNQILQSNIYSWNTNEKKWELDTKIDFENIYDSNNTLISAILYEKRKSIVDIKTTKYIYTYDGNGISTAIFYEEVPIGKLVENTKIEFHYDPNGDLSIMTLSRIYESHWIVKGSNEFKYNINYSMNELLLPVAFIPNDYVYLSDGRTKDFIFPIDFKINHMIASMNGSQRYYYSPMDVTGINDQEALKTTVFPNPATDFLNFQWNGNQSVLNVELFNVTGKKVFTGMVGNNSKLPIQSYPEGLYLVRILDGNKTVKTEKVYFK